MKPLTLDKILTAIDGHIPSPANPCSIAGVSIDSRTTRTGDIFFAIRGDRFDGHDFVIEALSRGALYAVVSNAERFADDPLRARITTVDDTVAALGRLAAYHRQQISADVIAVTGSNGKTTTKAMIGHVLSANKEGRCALKSYNNNIGVPLTLLSANSADEFLVVEIGTNHPGEIGHLGSLVKPDIGVITAVAAAHLESLKNIEGVVNEKLALLDHIKKGGMAVVNIDQPMVRNRLRKVFTFNLVTTGLCQDADLRVADLRADGKSITFSINGRFDIHMTVPGQHNACNALVAYAVGRRLGITSEQIIERLANFELPEMRLQMHQYGSIMVINDCYNANPASMQAAIDVIDSMNTPGRRVAIVGDMRELGEHAQAMHEELGRIVAASGLDVLLTVGDYSGVVCDSARRARRRRIELHASNTVDELSERIHTLLKPKDTVLLKASRALKLEQLVENISRS